MSKFSVSIKELLNMMEHKTNFNKDALLIAKKELIKRGIPTSKHKLIEKKLKFLGADINLELSSILDIIHDQWYARDKVDYNLKDNQLFIPFTRLDTPDDGDYVLTISEVLECKIQYKDNHVEDMFVDLSFDTNKNIFIFKNMLGTISVKTQNFNLLLYKYKNK